MVEKRKVKILWLSRHKPLESQISTLKEVFGDVEVVQDPRPFDSAEEIAERFRKGGFDELVAVAPLSVIAKLIELGIKPLFAVMEQTNPDEAEVEASGRFFRFKGFKRIARITIEYEDL